MFLSVQTSVADSGGQQQQVCVSKVCCEDGIDCRISVIVSLLGIDSEKKQIPSATVSISYIYLLSTIDWTVLCLRPFPLKSPTIHAG